MYITGRDQGLPTFLDVIRKCNLNARYSTFDDLMAIFPKTNVQLLRETYDSVEDIDLIVGGALETFSTFDQVLAGASMGCIIGEQYRHSMGGDAYFYTHKTNPHPFTYQQIDAIHSFSFSHLICTNSNIEFITKFWFLVESSANPKISCSSFKNFDLTAWSQI